MKLDVVIPLYDESESAPDLIRRLLKELSGVPGVECKCILVDDGSTDGTGAILDDMAALDARIEVVHLWGNHGHQRALIAGLDQCDADIILMMDGDGQHPVPVAIELITKAKESPTIPIIQAVRRGTQESLLKDITSRLFYACVNRIVRETRIEQGASDFRVIRREVLDLLMRYPDRYRNLRVLVGSLCLPTLNIKYDVLPRIGGQSKYGLRKMLDLAANGLFAFSMLPLRLCLFFMVVTGVLGVSYLLYALVVYMRGMVVPGWTSTIALILILFASVFGVLAILAEYIQRIYEDVSGHPVYRIRPSSLRPLAKDRNDAEVPRHD